MSKVEDVARALRQKLMDMEPERDWPPITDPIDPKELLLARAAVEAMRNPTDAMIAAANAAMRYRVIGSGPGGRETLIAGVNAMIDAALAEDNAPLRAFCRAYKRKVQAEQARVQAIGTGRVRPAQPELNNPAGNA